MSADAKPVGAHGIAIRDGWFVDGAGRHVLLRGVNLGGDSKLPTGIRSGNPRACAADGQSITFVGRPFPLSEADEHLARISHWGFNVIRLVITWEAVEHEGPGVYDEDYLEFLRGLVIKAGRHSLLVFIDPHQDVWSRFTGGDGAPLWTFELAGLVPTKFSPAGAVQLNSFDWFHNYETVPVATMWTLFWAGDAFCPEIKGVQSELQSRFAAMLATVAERLRDVDCVLGYDSLNEPSGGYIGRSNDLAVPVTHFVGDGAGLRPWSALEYLAAADGVPVVGSDGRQLNKNRISIWSRGCPWRRAGVWDLDRRGRPALVDGDYFARFDDRPVELWSDFMAPFFRRLHSELKSHDPDCILFLEARPHHMETAAIESWLNLCDASHWYDLPTLSTRRFNPASYRTTNGTSLAGSTAIAAQFARELGDLKSWSQSHMAGAPLLIGEFGVPFDINGKVAFTNGDYSVQEAALAANYSALDSTLLNSTQWNYSATNRHIDGDGWNFEDLSIWSADDVRPGNEVDSGGRAIGAFCRPYVRLAAGLPVSMVFNEQISEFRLVIETDPAIDAPTEVYVPRQHFGRQPVIMVSAGSFRYDPESQELLWLTHGVSGPAALTIRPA